LAQKCHKSIIYRALQLFFGRVSGRIGFPEGLFANQLVLRANQNGLLANQFALGANQKVLSEIVKSNETVPF
jgi:hypothetical protein